MSARAPFHVRTAGAAVVWYGVLAVAMTWPLALGLGRDIPWDTGDPILNCWILAHNAERMLSALAGRPAALAGFWTAGIFHPEPLTLAYSEALIPQAIQILPVWALTRNPLLCYNLVFLSTFVLSGLGVYLWLRAVTGDPRAAFVAGMLYAFALYRVGQFSHLQVLSSQWMPFALFAFRRYFDTGHRRALVGAALALWVQNLSCGYFMVFFAPFAGAYLAWEVVDRGRWREPRTLAALGVTLAATIAATVPFLLPYLELRARGLGTRPEQEILAFSADVYSYLSTRPELRVWGGLARAFPKPEGELFPGVVLPLFALVGAGGWMWRRLGERADGGPGGPWWRRGLTAAALVALLGHLLASVVVLAVGRHVWTVGPMVVRLTDASRVLNGALVSALALVALSPRARRLVRGVPGSVVGFSLAAAAAAVLLSFGPRIRTMGYGVGAGPYGLLAAIVPGMDALRVPARFGMIALLFLSALAAYGAAAIGRWRRAGPAIVWLLAGVFLAEATVVPLSLNVRLATRGVRLTAPGPLPRGDAAPPVYRAVAGLGQAVLLELPFGVPAFELHYMFHAIEHGAPLVNGYSGFEPPGYTDLRDALQQVPFSDPDRAWRALQRSSATHVVVHAGAFWEDEGAYLAGWLEAHGARVAGVYGPDSLYVLPWAVR